METQSQAFFSFYVFSLSQRLILFFSPENRLFLWTPELQNWLKISAYIAESTLSSIMSKIKRVPPIEYLWCCHFNVEHFHPSTLGSSQNGLDPEGSPLTPPSHLQFLREHHCFYFHLPPLYGCLGTSYCHLSHGHSNSPGLVSMLPS